MKISFSTVGCPDWPWNEVLVAAKDLGYDGIELRGIEGQLYLPRAKAFSGRGLEKTKETLSRTGLKIPCLASSCYLHMASEREERLQEGRDYIDLASKLGTPFVRVLGDSEPEPGVGDEAVGLVEEAVIALGDYAEKCGVKILLETNGYWAKSSRMSALMARVAGPGVGVLWDFHHPFRFFGESIGETYANLKDYIAHIHVKDSRLTGSSIRYCLVGEGDLPIQQTFELLAQEGYDGWISLEWVKRWRPDLEEPGIVFPHFIDLARKSLS